MTRHCALIAGVSGAVGRALGKYLAAHEDWEVIGLARRVPPRSLDYPVISVDLTDAGACRATLGELKNVTHVLYCARAAHTAAVREPIDVNLAMLRYLLEAIEPVAPGPAQPAGCH
ncbi:MAG: NAD-dependent epimerase/dehydratase family protein [Betaproteobacteria bacterium]|nr:NAD-dependent epimerase/dehydratase family protein [Betaproteobacteria bacterium]